MTICQFHMTMWQKLLTILAWAEYPH